MHAKCFEQAKDAFDQSMGKSWMEEFVKHTADCVAASDDGNKQAELTKDGPEQLSAFVFVKNSKQRKCD